MIYIPSDVFKAILSMCTEGESAGRCLSRLIALVPAQSVSAQSAHMPYIPPSVRSDRAVLDCLMQAESPLTASNVHRRVALSKPTVSRCLSQLLNDGLARSGLAVINGRALTVYSYVHRDGEQRRACFVAAGQAAVT